MPAFADEPPKALSQVAVASLKDAAGKPVGAVAMFATKHGTLVSINGHDLPPGWHGIHFHGVGSCEDPQAGFKASGGHAAHEGEAHGVASAKSHLGDLPNIFVGADGIVKADAFTAATPKELLDKDGSAVVLHAKADDYLSQPAGASGDRIACGALVKK